MEIKSKLSDERDFFENNFEKKTVEDLDPLKED